MTTLLNTEERMSDDFLPTAVFDQIVRQQERIKTLERENAELRRDAKRYRWLREIRWIK